MSAGSRVVVVTAPIEDDDLARAQALAPDLRIERHSGEAVPDALWPTVEILYTSGGAPRPERAPALRWVQVYSAGVDRVLEQPLFSTSTVFTNTSGIHAVPIAEHVLGMILWWSERLDLFEAYRQRRYWPSEEERVAQFSTPDLWGRTIGIVGYGSIGRHVARLAAGFGMRVLALQRNADHRDHGFTYRGVGDHEGTLPDRYYPPEALHELLAAGDVVVIALPLTPTTRGLFDEAAIRAMKPGALLVNIARGAICDEAALHRALHDGRIAAALDVFSSEPLPPDDPIWAAPNLLFSPHVSGYSAQTTERAAAVWIENLRRYLAGEPLFNVVDKEHGY